MKSKFVTSLWILAVVVSVLGLISGSLVLLSLWAIRSQPELLAILQESLTKWGLSISSEEVDRMLMKNGISTLGGSVLSLWIGLAIRSRKPWSRVASIYLIMAITVGMVVSIFSVKVQPSFPLYWAGVALTVLAVILHTAIILKLRSPEIRSEFEIFR